MSALTRWAYRLGSRRISLLPVSSPFFQPFLRSAFHLTDEVRVLGEPRTDVLFQGTPDELTAAARELLARRLGDLGESQVVLFAPTAAPPPVRLVLLALDDVDAAIALLAPALEDTGLVALERGMALEV